MASKTSLSTVLFLSMNFLFFAFVTTATTYPTPSSSTPKGRPSSGRSQSNPTTNPSNGQSSPTSNPSNGQSSPTPNPSNGQSSPTPNPSNGQSSPTPNPSNGQSSPTPNPSNGQSSPTPNRPSTGQASPTPAPAPSQPASCPRDALKFGVCANLLGGLIGLSIGTPPTTPCCPLIAGLADLEAAICLCTAIKANVLNIINLSIPLSLSVILDACERRVPTGFTCA